MLTTQSYLIAMLLYWAAALIGLVLMRRLWFKKPVTRSGGAVLGLIGGLLLTPAFPGPDVASMAPALIVVVFNTLFGEGLSSATLPALWLLAGSCLGVIAGSWRAGKRATL